MLTQLCAMPSNADQTNDDDDDDAATEHHYVSSFFIKGRLIVFDVEKENEPVREAKLRTSIGNGNTEIHAVQAFYDPDNPIESTDFVVGTNHGIIRA